MDWENLQLALWQSRGKIGWGYLAEATVNVRALFRRRVPSSRFVVLAQPRSGSRLLCELLDAHSQIQCDMEILYARVLRPDRFIRCRARLSQCDTYGFKCMLYQLTQRQRIADARAFLSGLHAEGWRIIYLRRRNMLRLVLSILLWRQSGKAHRYGAKHGLRPGVEKLTVNCEHLHRRLEKQQHDQCLEEEALRDLPCFRVVYDEDLDCGAAQQRTLARIFEWLGLENESVASDLVRNTPKRLVDLIENYDEVAESLTGTPYAQFLD
jgi:hypothetical protein